MKPEATSSQQLRITHHGTFHDFSPLSNCGNGTGRLPIRSYKPDLAPAETPT